MSGLPDRLKWIPMFLKALDEARLRAGQTVTAATASTTDGTRSQARGTRTSGGQRPGSGRRSRMRSRPAKRLPTATPLAGADENRNLLERIRKTEAALRELQAAQADLKARHAALTRELETLRQQLEDRA